MKGQNTSSAVMAQRQEARDSLDDFPTPPWATRALTDLILTPMLRKPSGPSSPLKSRSVIEPCCNRGHMVRPLHEAFGRVLATDIHDYGDAPERATVKGQPFRQHGVADFLFPGYEDTFPRVSWLPADWIITNPPFRLAEQIITKALRMADEGVAIFQRISFTEGVERYKMIFERRPPTVLAIFSERVVLHRGVLRDPEKSYFDEATGKMKKPSTATAYCWLVWLKGWKRQPPEWIGPDRRQLTRAGDYPAIEVDDTKGPLL